MWFGKSKSGQRPPRKDAVASDSGINSDFILSAIEDGVIMVGQDNVIHLFNPAAAQISGWPAQEAIGSNFASVFPFIDKKGQPLKTEDNPIAKALLSGKTTREPAITVNTRYGRPTILSIIVSPVNNKDGAPLGSVVGVFRDVTKEKEAEQQRSDFVSTASHEMRTPLAAIEGYLSLALNPKIAHMDQNAQKYIQKASDATKHLGVLFQDLLTSSRVEDGRLVSYPIVVEIGETIAQIVDNERFHAKEKNLTLNYVVSAPTNPNGAKVVRPLYYTYVDPNRVREVLQNIIDNAIKYTMDGGITVRLTGDDSVVQIQVQDTGVGIPAEDIQHLFQKFYRVDSSATRTVGGTGLGLFISKKIIELYNGRVWVESELGQGSTFFINLPRLTTAQALEMQRKQAATVSPLDRNYGVST